VAGRLTAASAFKNKDKTRYKKLGEETKVRTIRSMLCVWLGACCLAAPAFAADSTCNPIKLIVPFGVGGATDIGARALANALQGELHQNLVIENRPGATGNIGTLDVVHAAPDGCTLLINGTVIATFTKSFPNLAFDPFKDLAPVGGVGATPAVVVSAASSPAHSLTDLIALAKTHPNTITYATSGYGLSQHLVIEQIAQRSGVSFVLVPYKSPASMVQDVVAGRIDFASLLAGTTKPLIDSNQLRAQVLIQDVPSSLLPGVPTTAEQGFPGLLGGVQFAMFAPAGTPKPVIDRLDTALRRVLAAPDMIDTFRRIGFEPMPLSPAEVTAEMKKQDAMFSPIITSLNIHLE
jgi:tripartite-type tricarboxylate transporter receptor subunit TctC